MRDLDPLPYVGFDYGITNGMRYAEKQGWMTFNPRPEYSQEEEDYKK